jgi:hypothetical protein
MCGTESKKFSWVNFQNLSKFKVFKAYGFLLYYMGVVLHGKYLIVLCVLEPVV